MMRMSERSENDKLLDKIGIGVDLESINRIARADADYVEGFLEKIFSAEEIRGFKESGKDQEKEYISRFSAKESIIKALSNTGIKKVNYHDILIRNEDDGTPRVELLNPRYKGVEIKLSMSHSAGMTVSFAIAIRGSSK
jgi:holo-[acyl-carrier protein] synthase